MFPDIKSGRFYPLPDHLPIDVVALEIKANKVGCRIGAYRPQTVHSLECTLHASLAPTAAHAQDLPLFDDHLSQEGLRSCIQTPANRPLTLILPESTE